MIPGTLAAVSIGLDAPWWLLAAVAAAAPILLAWRARRRGRYLNAAGVALQCLAILAGAGALSQPTAPLGGQARRAWLVATDVSGSMRGQDSPGWTWPAGVPKEDYVFADSLAPAAQGIPPTAAGATRIAGLLAFLQARAGLLAGAVIRTDGRFQDEAWPAAANALSRTGLPIWIVPADAAGVDACVADFRARRSPGGLVQLTLSIAANAHQTRTIRVAREGSPAPLLERPLKLLAGETQTIQLTDSPAAGTPALYKAALSPAPDDKFPENDSASLAVAPSQSRVLSVAAGGAFDPAATLAAGGLKVDSRSPADLPSGAEGLRPWSALCLADPAGTALTAAQRAAVASYVREGGGLVLLGTGPCTGPADFDDPLNRAAALVANPYQRRPLKLIVILDASGSMGQEALVEGSSAGGMRKFDLAVEALQGLKAHLSARDSLTVIRFAETASIAYDSGPGQIDFGRLHAIDRATTPTGSTRIRGALELALKSAPDAAREGLVLIVSDLETQDADWPAAELARRFAAARLSVAAVVTSPDQQKLNPALARFLDDLHADRIASERLAGLTDLFARFVRGARGEPIRRGAFTATGEGAVLGISNFSLPLAAYLPSALKPDALTLARVGADPVIATRQAGLGKVLSIALPVTPADNPALAASATLAALLPRAAAWAARTDLDPRFTGQVIILPHARRLVILADDPKGPIDSLDLSCQVARTGTPDEPPHAAAPLLQTAPGRYEAALPPPAGPETLQVSLANGPVVWWSSPAHLPTAEFSALGADWQTLRRLANLTGARLLAPAQLSDLPAHVRHAAARDQSPLWPWLLALALAAMLADWCTTRVLQRGK